MIPHHAQAAEMANMANSQATNPKLKKLATAMMATQQPELKSMSDQMTRWGMPVPTMGNGHDMGSMGRSQQWDDDQRPDGRPGQARGAGFDRMWLEMMIEHHQGAVAVARTELAQGSNPDSKKLARFIVDAQSAEITQMSSMMATIGN